MGHDEGPEGPDGEGHGGRGHSRDEEPPQHLPLRDPGLDVVDPGRQPLHRDQPPEDSLEVAGPAAFQQKDDEGRGGDEQAPTPEGDLAAGQQCDGDGAAYRLLDVGSHEGYLEEDPEEDAGPSRVGVAWDFLVVKWWREERRKKKKKE